MDVSTVFNSYEHTVVDSDGYTTVKTTAGVTRLDQQKLFQEGWRKVDDHTFRMKKPTLKDKVTNFVSPQKDKVDDGPKKQT